MHALRAQLGGVVVFASAMALAACGSSGDGNAGGTTQPDASDDGGRGTADSDAGGRDGGGGGSGDGSTSGSGHEGGSVAEGGSVSEGGAVAEGGSPTDAGLLTDGSTPGDGSTGTTGTDGAVESGAGPGTCGSTSCRDGETCAAGLCVSTGCVGAKVPGDYQTVNDAVVALSPAGGTICLAAQTYAEDVSVTSLTGSLTFIGVSAAQTTVRSFHVVESPATTAPVALHLQSLSTQQTSTIVFTQYLFTASVRIDDCTLVSNDTQPALALGSQGTVTGGGMLTVDVTASRLVATSGGAGLTGVSADSQSSNLVLTVDGVDFETPATALSVITYQALSAITVKNCYVHDSATGVEIQQLPAGGPVTVVNNTFARNKVAFDLMPGAQTTLYNNLFDGNTTAIEVTSAVPASSFGNNALWNNTTNYAGHAVVGTAYVFGDPMLDTATPPGLLPGSSCRAAGNATYAPATDYWGHARGGSVDLGAVQSQ